MRKHLFLFVREGDREVSLLGLTFHFAPLGLFDCFGRIVRAWSWSIHLGNHPGRGWLRISFIDPSFVKTRLNQFHVGVVILGRRHLLREPFRVFSEVHSLVLAAQK